MTAVGLICARVVDLKTPADGSVVNRCVDCGQDIWVDPRSVGKVVEHHGVGPILICLDCAEDEIDRVGFKEIVEETIRMGIGE